MSTSPLQDQALAWGPKETRYIDCKNVELPYGEQLVSDVVNRTETAMTQQHCFAATELMLKAQKQAQRVNGKA